MVLAYKSIIRSQLGDETTSDRLINDDWATADRAKNKLAYSVIFLSAR